MRHKATHLLKKNEKWMLPSWTFSFVSWWTESFHSEFLSIWCGQYCTSTIDIPPVSRWLRLVICKPRSRYGIWYLWKNRIETTERAEVEKSWQSLIWYFQFDSGIGKKLEITMSIRHIFCLRFPNRQFECETMSLAGTCWNMMASSVFPKKSVFRKIKITEKICLAYQMPPKVLVFP